MATVGCAVAAISYTIDTIDVIEGSSSQLHPMVFPEFGISQVCMYACTYVCMSVC